MPGRKGFSQYILRHVWIVIAFAACLGSCAQTATVADAMVSPGSPKGLIDWRWLARAPQCEHKIVSDSTGAQKLEAAQEGNFWLLRAEGPGVLDHIWTTAGNATLMIEVDGQLLWQGRFDDLGTGNEKKNLMLFPTPVFFSGGGMRHLVAPVGFRESLRISVDKPTFPHYLSYRLFPRGTAIIPASSDPNGEYARGLRFAADQWKQTTSRFAAKPEPPLKEVRKEFTLQARQRVPVLDLQGSGEITHLEFHLNPALTGTLREVVVELFYDGHKDPFLRLPLTDLAGVPHPWPCGRWDGYNGDLAAGIQYPWYVHTPRFYYPEVTIHFNLPIPFAKGARVELMNRSQAVRFAGYARAIVAPVEQKQTAEIGRLCGTRTISRLTIGEMPQPMVRVPGPGQLVGLGLFTTGGSPYPPAVHKSVISLSIDGKELANGPGVLPLWFRGIYGGAVVGMPIWNHPRYEDQYGGVMRHFLTDPVPFAQEATLAFTPGTDPNGAPTQATAIALWYHFGAGAYVAPPLSPHAEHLPYSTYNASAQRLGPDNMLPQEFWMMEAEDLVPLASVHGGEVRAVEDVDHNYHPSKGWYLQIVADQPGDYVDFVVAFPHTRYFAVGTLALWGPNRGKYEIDVLSREQAKARPEFPQGNEFYTGRVLGSVPMKAPVFMGHSLSYRRDAGVEYPAAFLNPAPDDEGVLRFICQTKPHDSSAYILKLDQIRLDMPPPTQDGWHEFEEGLPPEVEQPEALRYFLPKYGRFTWSGWGAVQLIAKPGGKAVFRAFLPTGPEKPTVILIKGSLGPTQGQWQARLLDSDTAISLSPGRSHPEKEEPDKDRLVVLEWKLPVTDLTFPGEIALEFTCTSSLRREASALQIPPAELTLDAWAVQ